MSPSTMVHLTRYFPVSNGRSSYEQLHAVTKLNGAKSKLHSIIFIPAARLVVGINKNSVFAYDIDRPDELCNVFNPHSSKLNGILLLSEDIVASVGSSKLISWRAPTRVKVGEWEHGNKLCSLAKFDESSVAVGDVAGNVIILSHENGESFRVRHLFKASTFGRVHYIAVHNQLIVTYTNSYKFWDASSFKLLATHSQESTVMSLGLSETVTILSEFDYFLRVLYRDSCQSKSDFVLILRDTINHVTILNDDVIYVLHGNRTLNFISLASKSYVCRIPLEERCHSSTVLDDGRIAVVGKNGYCAILTLPTSVRGLVENYAASLYQSSTVIENQIPVTPLRAAWVSVQNNQLSRTQACTTIITSENCSASFDEWCVAHNLLMEAVRYGDIPRSRDYGDSIAHWHSVLYQHCAKLVVNEKCLHFMKSMFRQAEDAGVIASGQVESFINTVGVRRDMENDNRLLVHAIYQLFIRQVETDKRLSEVLHYQRVQQLTSLVNAVIGCVPVLGAIATNAISGGASILNDYEVCGLVESILGIGTDGVELGTNHLVDRFLHKTNTVLSEEQWSLVPEEKKKLVEDAALSLGLTVEELREKLLTVAEMEAVDTSESITVEEICDDNHENDNNKYDGPAAHEVGTKMEGEVGKLHGVAGGPTPSTRVVLSTADEIVTELALWKERGVSKESVEQLNSKDVAKCLAAFTVNFEASLGELFLQIKHSLTEVLGKKFIFGTSIVHADEERKELLANTLVQVITDGKDENLKELLKMRVELFIRLASE